MLAAGRSNQMIASSACSIFSIANTCSLVESLYPPDERPYAFMQKNCLFDEMRLGAFVDTAVG